MLLSPVLVFPIPLVSTLSVSFPSRRSLSGKTALQEKSRCTNNYVKKNLSKLDEKAIGKRLTKSVYLIKLATYDRYSR